MNGLEAIDFMRNGGKVSLINDYAGFYEIKDNKVWLTYPHMNISGDISHNFDLSKEYCEYNETKNLAGWFRVPNNHNYYSISSCGVVRDTELNASVDCKKFASANYFTDVKKAEEIDFKQTLFRKLQRFSDENGGDKIDWKDEDQCKYHIKYTHYSNNIYVEGNHSLQEVGVVYFINEQITEQAIELFHDDLIKYFTM